MTRILVVDDHEMIRAGLAAVLANQSDFVVVGSVGSGEDAVQAATDLVPDVVLMDLDLPGISGIEATRLIVQQHPSVKVMIISTFEEPHDIAAAIEAGARGYYAKHVRPEELVTAIRSIVTEDTALSPSIAARLIEAGGVKSPNDLTPREREVLDLIVEGNTNRQIASRLGISEKTVKTHCGHLFQRLGVRDRTQAAVWAERHLPRSGARRR